MKTFGSYEMLTLDRKKRDPHLATTQMGATFQRFLKIFRDADRREERHKFPDDVPYKEADKIVELSKYKKDEKLKYLGSKYTDSKLHMQIKGWLCNTNDRGYSKIRSLEIHSTQVETIPIEIGMYCNLTNLDISNNMITDIPWYLIYLKKLLYLNLSDNSISEIPYFIGNLTSLVDLDLKNNEIVRLPTSLLKLTRLRYLDVTKNNALKSPPYDTCCGGKSAIFEALQKRLGRKNLWANCRLYYNDTENNVISNVQLLMEICVDNILKNDIEFWLYRNIPPKLKKGLQQEKESREYFPVKHCSVCYKYFSNDTFFDNHNCRV